MPNSTRPKEAFARDIRHLGDTLGRVIRRQAGIHIYDLEERVRALTKTRRDDVDLNIDSYVQEIIEGLDLKTAELVSRAFTVYFELINLAEELQRMRVLRRRERKQHPLPMKESITAAVAALRQQGVDEFEMQRLLDRLHIELVFTAHPTQAKRRTVLSKLRRISDALTDLSLRDLLPVEEQKLLRHITAEITSLWLTNRSRTAKITVEDEVKTGLYYLDTTIWDAIPDVYEAMEEALKEHYPTLKCPTRFLTFGSWIGGDRDGNPNVTADITARTLHLHRGLALTRHRQMASQIKRSLTFSDTKAEISPELIEAIEGSRRNASAHLAYLNERYPNEPYRLWAASLAEDLADASKGSMVGRLRGEHNDPVEIHSLNDLLAPLNLMNRTLREMGQADVARDMLATMRRQAQVFGVHVARLDIRQFSDYNTAVLDELFQKLGRYDGFAQLDGEARGNVLSEQLQLPIPDLGQLDDLSPEATETLNLFAVLERAISFYGDEIIGHYIVSMTHGPEDILAPLLLAYWHHLCLRPAGEDGHVPSESLSFVPLLETRDDLRAATDVLNALFEHPAYKPHLERLERKQTIMIGYSDSNKDAGYLAANWELYEAQERMAACCREAGVMMTLFHGRGGTIARGGGPANRAILAQPLGSVNGRIRITEQGEVIDERYGHPAIARRHLEQVVHAVLMSSKPGQNIRLKPAWRDAMTQLAATSYRTYRSLVYETPELLEYWQTSTPISEISQMQIGSRPARRTAKATFDSLRAIPWGFSWMQSRQVLPGWFGVGEALDAFIQENEGGEALLKEMYQEWDFFKVVINNAQVSLVKADMSIARIYADLVEDEAVRDQIFGQIEASFELTRRWILRITDQRQILENDPVLRTSVERRNPYIDPLNFIQVNLIRRLRQLEEDDGEEAKRILRVIFLTINGIASGLKNTG